MMVPSKKRYAKQTPRNILIVGGICLWINTQYVPTITCVVWTLLCFRCSYTAWHRIIGKARSCRYWFRIVNIQQTFTNFPIYMLNEICLMQTSIMQSVSQQRFNSRVWYNYNHDFSPRTNIHSEYMLTATNASGDAVAAPHATVFSRTNHWGLI